MRSRFSALWTRAVGEADPERAWTRLDSGYDDAGRVYHGWAHIRAMLENLDAARPDPEFGAVALDEVELAVFFHDAVYDPTRHDNEPAIAALCTEMAGRRGTLGPDGARRVGRLIRATAKHGPSDDVATRLLIDVDLAILGSDAGSYADYARAVRAEYGHVPDELWRVGRRGVLERFSARARLFQTAFFGRRLEAAARDNLAAELAALAGG